MFQARIDPAGALLDHAERICIISKDKRSILSTNDFNRSESVCNERLPVVSTWLLWYTLDKVCRAISCGPSLPPRGQGALTAHRLHGASSIK